MTDHIDLSDLPPKRKRRPRRVKPRLTPVLLRRYRSILEIETNRVYRESIMSLSGHYKPEVIKAWMGDFCPDYWDARMKETHVLVADAMGQSVGFIDIDEMGFIDMLYVSPLIAHRGVGTALLTWAHYRATLWNLPELAAIVPKSSVNFFFKNGFRIEQQQQARRGNALIDSLLMTKRLTKEEPPPPMPPSSKTLMFIQGGFPIVWESGTEHPLDEESKIVDLRRSTRRHKPRQTNVTKRQTRPGLLEAKFGNSGDQPRDFQ